MAGFRSGVIFLFGLTCLQAQALVPIERLQENLKVSPNSKKMALGFELAGAALASLEAGRFVQARARAATLKKMPRLSDYGHWLEGAAWVREGVLLLRSGKSDIAAQAAEKAALALRNFEDSVPYSPLGKKVAKELALALVLSADAHAAVGKWPRAIQEYETAFQKLSVHFGNIGLAELRPESLLGFGKVCAKTKALYCESWSQRLASVVVKGSEEAKALAKGFPSAWGRDKADGFDRRTRAYKTADLDFSAFDAAMGAYWEGRYGKAIEAFRRFMDEFPKSSYRFRVRYWLAQAMRQEKDEASSKVVLENLQLDAVLTYYGLLSSFDSGLGLDHGISAILPLAEERDEYLQPHELFRVARAEDFLKAGAGELAALELRDLKARDNLSGPFLMYLALLNHLAGQHTVTFSLLNELLQRGYENVTSSFVVKMIFPRPLGDLVDRIAKDNDLDPVLVLSLVKQESSFEAEAVSPSGAMGLMQLMPATAVDTDPKVLRADLQRAEANLRVGAKYLKQLMTRFNGNIVLSLAGYNAGPNAADRWYRQAPSGRTMVEFIESIPYRETREYVASIIRNYYWYTKRLGTPERGLEYFWRTK